MFLFCSRVKITQLKWEASKNLTGETWKLLRFWTWKLQTWNLIIASLSFQCCLKSHEIFYNHLATAQSVSRSDSDSQIQLVAAPSGCGCQVCISQWFSIMHYSLVVLIVMDQWIQLYCFRSFMKYVILKLVIIW